jgi:hypothetical protein
MADRRRTSSWLGVSWRAQPDGSFLIRPLGASPLVYLTDAPTKERLVRFVRAYHAWQFWVLLLSALVTLPVIIALWQDWFWWACAADFALCYLLTIVILWTGELVILRKAVRVPTSEWPEIMTSAPHTRWWREILLLVGAILSFVAVAEGPQYLPFFPWMWIATALVIASLVLLIRLYIADQRTIAAVAGIAPASPADPATRRDRILLASLTAALANPIAVIMLVNHLIREEFPLTLGPLGLLLALSGGCALLLGLYFLLTRGIGGIRWHLTAAAIAMPALSSVFYFMAFSPVPMHLAFWLSVVSAAAIAFPVAAAFWLIARPERYA